VRTPESGRRSSRGVIARTQSEANGTKQSQRGTDQTGEIAPLPLVAHNDDITAFVAYTIVLVGNDAARRMLTGPRTPEDIVRVFESARTRIC